MSSIADIFKDPDLFAVNYPFKQAKAAIKKSLSTGEPVSLMVEGGGVGDVLFEECHLHADIDPTNAGRWRMFEGSVQGPSGIAFVWRVSIFDVSFKGAKRV